MNQGPAGGRPDLFIGLALNQDAPTQILIVDYRNPHRWGPASQSKHTASGRPGGVQSFVLRMCVAPTRASNDIAKRQSTLP